MDREPKESDVVAFARLFEEAYRRCFSAPFSQPLTEAESHRLSVEIAESTGLEIGWKSLKNYSLFLLGRAARSENPSLPTLDTLARYVAGAPRTDEARRRAQERHYPYWVRYREAFQQAEPAPTVGVDLPIPRLPSRKNVARAVVVVAALGTAFLLLLVWSLRHRADRRPFTDDFDDVSTAALAARGWAAHDIDSVTWAQRGATPGQLTLFTLEGDNWPQSGRVLAIKNALVRRLSAECFAVEVRFNRFFPRQNWQQAGLLLLEDTTLTGRSVRMSVGYNDFSGGFPQTREVIVQAITSLGRGSDKPEEIVHRRLFVVDSATEPLVRRNLESSAVRIERRGSHLRLLSSAGPMKNAAFTEIGGTDFDFRPAYVAVFAMKGFVSEAGVVPVHVDAFSQRTLQCAR